MNLKFTLSVLSVIVVALLFIFQPNVPMAQTKEKSQVILKNITADGSRVKFSVPEAANITYSDEELNSGNHFLVNGQTIVQIELSDMVVQIDEFDVSQNFNHLDWLRGYAQYLRLSHFTVDTVQNSSGLTFGILEYSIKESNKRATAYLVIEGQQGYFISGTGPWSDPLVRNIVLSLVLSGDN